MRVNHLALLLLWFAFASAWSDAAMTNPLPSHRQYFEIDLPVGVTVTAESPVEDFILYRFQDKGETILTVYVGNAPNQKGFGSGAIIFRTDALQVASTWEGRVLVRREWLIRRCTKQWPQFLHLITGKNAERGDRLAFSVRVRTPSGCQ